MNAPSITKRLHFTSDTGKVLKKKYLRKASQNHTLIQWGFQPTTKSCNQKTRRRRPATDARARNLAPTRKLRWSLWPPIRLPGMVTWSDGTHLALHFHFHLVINDVSYHIYLHNKRRQWSIEVVNNSHNYEHT